MSESRFRIVFEKIAQETDQQGCECVSQVELESIRAELEEVAELRRLALEIAEPEPMSYTST